MTIFTIISTGDVVQALAFGDNAVVASAACAQHLRVVYRVNRRPHIRVMAVFANIGRLNMRGVLASGLRTVVAADAVADYANVVEVRRQPPGRRVAIIAGDAAGNVRGVLAGRRETIMTGTAGTQNLSVINRVCRREHIGIVAVFADA